MESSSVLFGGIIMADKYRIGEVAKLLGVTTSAIRFYEKMGMVKPEKNVENGYRYYRGKDVKKLRSILCHRSMEMSLSVIDHLKHSHDLSEVKSMIEEQRTNSLQKIAEEEKMIRLYDFYCAIIDEVVDHSNRFTVKHHECLHLFASDFYYRPNSTVCIVGHPITTFYSDGSLEEHLMVCDRFINMLDCEEAAEEVSSLELSSSLYTVVRREGDIDERSVLQSAFDDAVAQGYRIRPPYYVYYLISLGEWETPCRFYGVILSLDDTKEI